MIGHQFKILKRRKNMKKRLSWVLFIAALLSLSMLFASCNSDEGGDEIGSGEQGKDNSGAETNTPSKDGLGNYSELIDQWAEYISYEDEGREGKEKFTSFTALFKDFDSSATVNVNMLCENVAVVHSVSDHQKLLSDVFYNLDSGEEIISGGISEVYSSTYKEKTHTYSYELIYDTIIEVMWTVKERPEGSNVGWEISETYSYYDVNGSEIAVDLEERAEKHNSFDCLSIDGKNYYCHEGKIKYVTEDLFAYELPVFDDRIEYNDKYYYVDDSGIEVFDAKAYRLYEFKMPSYGIAEDIKVLSNGNVYIPSMTALDESSQHFDIDENGQKYAVDHYIADLSSGKIMGAELDFTVEVLYNNANGKSDGIKLSGENQYAEIRMIKDGKLSKESEFVILDASLKIVKELPKLFKNQTGFIKMDGEGSFVMETSDLNGSTVNYLIDADGDAKIWNNAVSGTLSGSYNKLNGGYAEYVEENCADGSIIKKYEIYNDVLERIADVDFDDVEGIFGGNILFKSVTEETETETEVNSEDEFEPSEKTVRITEYKIGYIENGEFKTNSIYEGEESFDYDFYDDGCGYYIIKDSADDEIMDVLNSYGENIAALNEYQYVKVWYNLSPDSVVLKVRADEGNTYYIIK